MIHKLKVRLLQFGWIRPEAWKMIVSLGKEIHLNPDDRFVRVNGTLAFVAIGVLKEYDVEFREKPSIINFISSNQFIITRKHNQQHYLKTYTQTVIYTWEFEQLQKLYANFNDLRQIYELACETYDQSLTFRYLLLEETDTNRKISAFIKHKKDILPLIKKKDIANYLNISYISFIRNYSKYL